MVRKPLEKRSPKPTLNDRKSVRIAGNSPQASEYFERKAESQVGIFLFVPPNSGVDIRFRVR